MTQEKQKGSWKVYFVAAHLVVGLLGVMAFWPEELPEELVMEAEALPEIHQKLLATLDRQERLLKTQLASPEGRFLQPYATREKWTDHFRLARQATTEGWNRFETELAPLLENNRQQEKESAARHLKRINQAFFTAYKEARQPNERQTFLKRAKAEGREWVAQAQSHIQQLDQWLDEGLSAVDQAKKDYPDRADAILSRFVPLQKHVAKAHSGYEKARGEVDKLSANTADYGVLGDNVTVVTQRLESMEKALPAFESTLSELYQSYSKTLVDMRIRYFVQVGRAAWCEGESCGNGSTVFYSPVEVDEGSFEYFDALTLDLIAKERPGWSSDTFTLHIPKQRWDILKIRKNFNRQSVYDYADYWLEKLYIKTYHKYAILQNGKMTETDWQPVQEPFYWANERNLGMTLVAKPFGAFEDESFVSPAPVGLSFIAPPTLVDGHPTGSNQYGEWHHDGSSGQSFWAFYGKYRVISDLMTGSIGYGRYGWNEYDHWYRNYRSKEEPYYGEKEEYGTYGRYTYSGGSRYRHSDHARRYPRTVERSRSGKTGSAGKRAQTVSARGGGKSRNRGPGRSGK
ncbi:MAG: hypothetical protein HQL52_06315 [Magnetococcales bacterium]|nr:hypothetical protein [Magnetococcales bacterium]